jgi:fatty-acyl-CoA synthase
MNFWDALASRAGSSHSTLHCWSGHRFEAAPWSEVVRDAEAMTAGLRRAGVRPGATVATVLTNNGQVVRGFMAVWLAGGTIASLPVPARGMDVEEYATQLTSICRQLDPVMLLIEERLLGLIPPELGRRVVMRSWESLSGSGRVEPSPPNEDDVAFVQYSSGSTDEPRGCMLTPRAIAAQLEVVLDLAQGTPGEEVVVSWLPLSHDMGMFGCLLFSWAHDFDMCLSTPERFMFSPRSWFGDVADFGGTLSAGTNTALYLGARAYQSRRLPRELRLRSVIIGAERVEWGTLQRAREVLGPYGLREDALKPAYGLAEATLAVTAMPVGEAPCHVIVDPIALADGELRDLDPADPAATQIVSAGRPCRGVELPGASTDKVGPIHVRSPALATGYVGDPERTRERFRDGAFLTDDLGFVRDDYLYPVGRVDDVISISGRNVYAREIESAVDALDGVRRGCSTLVERRNGGAPTLTLLVELKHGLDDYRALAEHAASVAMAKAAVAVDECVFLEKGSLPKTPSGKIQRHRCRLMLDVERLEPLATINLAGS